MSRCIIIAPLYDGEQREWISPQPGDLLICADGGYRAAMAHGFVPGLVIGDFDSLGYVPEAQEVLQLPVHKDDTDMVVCIREGRARGFREFIAAGSIGGRFDHTMACLQCSADCAQRGESLWLCDAQNRVTVLSPGTYRFPKLEGHNLSFLAYTPTVEGICLTGTVWELNDAELTARHPLGCSNAWAGDEACLSFTNGLLIACITRD